MTCNSTRSPLTRATVLVVDDECLVRLMVADDLHDRDFSILEASSGDEAARMLREGTEVDLVFTDVRMPGSIDGLALARLIKSEFPEIKVLVASGQVPALPVEAADGFFPKPYELASVARKIESVLTAQAGAASCAQSRRPQHPGGHYLEIAAE